jgi:chemotaxis protein MotB
MPRKEKQKKPKEEPSAPLWLVTYSDMVTLLLCFFIMQLAFANFEDPGKVDAALEAIRAAFGTGGQDRGQKDEDNEKSTSRNTDFDQSSQESMHILVSVLRSVLAEMMSQNLVRMTNTKTEIRITLDETILFRPGSSDLSSSALGLVGDITMALKSQPVKVVVEGHADSDGTSEELNWKISAERAVAVIMEMRRRVDDAGIPIIAGKYLEAHGLGEFRPADVEKGTSGWNRRVEIVIRGRDTAAHGAINHIEQELGERNGRRN